MKFQVLRFLSLILYILLGASFHNIDSCCDHIVSMSDEWVGVEHW